MRGFQICLVFLLGSAAHALPQKNAEGRILSIFSVVNFPNIECKATVNENGGAYSGLMGTCLSSTECSDRAGEKKGSCGSGFGVCCVKSLKACGGDVSYNNTYIANVNYPTVLPSGANTCKYTVKRDGAICQLRLDFQDVVLVAGSTPGDQTATAPGRLFAVGNSGIEPPAISGTLTGDHMYVEVLAGSTDPTITLATLTGQTTQKWNIQVSQIKCDSQWKAPKDCTQWFTTNTGTIRSYNTRGTTKQELNGQNIMICIRQNKGFSGAVFTAQSFQVGGSTAKAGVGGANCASGNAQGALTIPGANTFCLGNLAPTNAQVNNAPVTVAKGPLRVHHYSSTSTAGTRTGFVIDYNQI